MNYDHPDNPTFDNESDSFTSLDLSLIDNIVLGGIDTNDYPDFSDAFIESADYEGREMTDEEMEWVQSEHPEFVQESVLNQII